MGQIDLIVDVVCHGCGDDLDVQDVSIGNYGTLTVASIAPCERCLRDAREEGREEE